MPLQFSEIEISLPQTHALRATRSTDVATAAGRHSLAQHRALTFAVLAAELGDPDTALDRASAIRCEHTRAEAFAQIAAALTTDS